MNNSFRQAFTLFILSIFLISCHSGYEKKNGKVYYKWIHGGNWTRENTLMEEADVQSFKTIKHDLNIHLGKDKNNVFKDADILEHADPSTFEQVKEYYWKDNNNVYLLQFGGTDCRIKNADPKTFNVIKDFNWAHDKNHVYYEFDKLEGVDPKAFIAVDNDWGKDNNFYYYHNRRVNFLDYQTAEIVSPII
jgi:hypothetical protein